PPLDPFADVRTAGGSGQPDQPPTAVIFEIILHVVARARIRHPQAEHGHVGPVGGKERKALGRRRGFGDDLDVRLFAENCTDADADKRLVLNDKDFDRLSAHRLRVRLCIQLAGGSGLCRSSTSRSAKPQRSAQAPYPYPPTVPGEESIERNRPPPVCGYIA